MTTRTTAAMASLRRSSFDQRNASTPASSTLIITDASPVREPDNHAAATPSTSPATATIIDHGGDSRRANTTAPTVQNPTTAPSLLASASVPVARIMYAQKPALRKPRSKN